jgi:hypothetical protein
VEELAREVGVGSLVDLKAPIDETARVVARPQVHLHSGGCHLAKPMTRDAVGIERTHQAAVHRLEAWRIHCRRRIGMRKLAITLSQSIQVTLLPEMVRDVKDALMSTIGTDSSIRVAATHIAHIRARLQQLPHLDVRVSEGASHFHLNLVCCYFVCVCM